MLRYFRTAGILARETVIVAITRRSRAEIVAFLILALLSLTVTWTGSLIFEPTAGKADYPAENGWHELLQAALLLSAAVLFYAAAVRFGFEIFYFSLFAAFFCGLAVLRETPRCASSYYEGGPCLSSDGKLIIGFALAATVIALLAWRRIPLARQVRDLNLLWILPVGFSGLMLIAAEIMGSYYIEVWKEETLELASYVNLTVFAMVLNIRPGWFDSRPPGAHMPP
ncbi:hypothetical protein [Aurantimonas marianensis]|uniref:Uncharacterized protein n=1 Tax=Aurantimonas marianensis TaxID=2920428 RepID=A0A9X2KGF2_9HYPH|nr:hypothetical protein [Aurantimonas marianensis]MCP3056381.1 hypothetical protein [Aurantimonas marianensis]